MDGIEIDYLIGRMNDGIGCTVFITIKDINSQPDSISYTAIKDTYQDAFFCAVSGVIKKIEAQTHPTLEDIERFRVLPYKENKHD